MIRIEGRKATPSNTSWDDRTLENVTDNGENLTEVGYYVGRVLFANTKPGDVATIMAVAGRLAEDIPTLDDHNDQTIDFLCAVAVGALNPYYKPELKDLPGQS